MCEKKEKVAERGKGIVNVDDLFFVLKLWLTNNSLAKQKLHFKNLFNSEKISFQLKPICVQDL